MFPVLNCYVGLEVLNSYIYSMLYILYREYSIISLSRMFYWVTVFYIIITSGQVGQHSIR